MSWSKLKKQFKERIAPCLGKRIDFHTTGYRGYTGSDDGRAWITIDGEEITNMAWVWEWYTSDLEAGRCSVFPQRALGEAMFAYLNNSIEDALVHENQLIRALSMLDRRLGKRRLQNMDVRTEPPLLQLLYLVRCQAEGIAIDQELSHQESDLKASVKNKHLFRKRDRPREIEESRRRVQQTEQILKQAGTDNLREIARFPEKADREQLRTDEGRALLDLLRTSQHPEEIRELITHVDTVSGLLDESRYARGVIALSEQSSHWLRRPTDWRPKTKNQPKQFASLARHLFADYSVPRFLDQAWLGDRKEARDWFRIVGKGQNLRHAENLPIKLTRKMAHWFLEAPDDYSISAALRWAQIRSMGGDRRLCDAVAETRLVRDFVDDPFWLSVFQFLIDNPMLDRRHVGPIVDYIWNRKFESVIVYVQRGVPEERPPVQPNFSMTGRQAETLLLDVERWHGELGSDINRPMLHWNKSPLGDFEFVEGAADERRTWIIRELVNTVELVAEGKRMSHCVASYDRSCTRGQCSIWTMEFCDAQGIHPKLTIELGHPNYAIQQARGKYNRLPNDQEKAVLARWETTFRDKTGLLATSESHEA